MVELSHIWQRIQGTLLPILEEHLGPISEKQQRLITILEVVRIENFVQENPRFCAGRRQSDRQSLARAFVCKAVYNMETTRDLIERLHSDRNLRRICGFESIGSIPAESTFSRAFAEFAQSALATSVHQALIEKYQSDHLVLHISRDSTEIEAREKPTKNLKPEKEVKTEKAKRGRPKKGEATKEKKETGLKKQLKMTLKEMLQTLPQACNRGSKVNSKGYVENWNGYKLHIDSADGELPISCILTSASVHDSQVALPLALMSHQRVDSLYDVMDAAYDAEIIKDHSRSLGHVPIIDHNKRRGEKIEMDPATAQRYKVRTTSERVNARLKDEFGGRHLRVRGSKKAMAHLMFGVLALSAVQLMQLVQVVS